MLSPRLSILCPALLLIGGSLLAQNPAAPAPANLLNNGGFERSTRTVDNLWDGVDGDGNLAVPPFAARALTSGSSLGTLAMPPSIAAADLTGDGKLDLLVASATGYYFYYQNIGTPTEPRFSSAELLPLFLSTSPETFNDLYHAYARPRDNDRFCPRISLSDWRKRGVLDLLVGNFFGEMMFIPNSGGVRAPAFSQPQSIDRAMVQTDDRNRLWANLLSPVAVDWNGDGKLDALVGEGTYSANAIHLLTNSGAETPKFSEVKRSIVAYGDGREHLIPTVADYNGDGYPDLLVADRTGEIGVYLNPGAPKTGVELTRASTISFGSASRLPGLVSPFAADLNGDGLFDLILGLPNGRLAVAYNTGTKTQPAFGAWRELKGEDRLKRNIRVTGDWDLFNSADFGNALGYFRVVNAQEDPDSAPPEGANCMKVGYWPAVTKGVFPFPDSGMPQGVQHFMLTHSLRLKVGKNYRLSFKVKGSGMDKCEWNFIHNEDSFTGSVKLDKGERGEAVREGTRVKEDVRITGKFSVSNDWASVEKTLTPKFEDAALKDKTDMEGRLEIDFTARGLSSVAYVDDVQITQLN